MKIINAGLLGLFLVSSALAAPQRIADLGCITDYPTTSFLIDKEDGIVTVRLYHHNGADYAPIYNGLLTPNDIPEMQNRARMIRELGDQAVFQFSEADCEMKEHWMKTGVFACFRGQKVTLGGHEVYPWAIHSVSKTETSFAGIYEKLEISISLEVNGKTYPVSMEYLANECGLGTPTKKKPPRKR